MLSLSGTRQIFNKTYLTEVSPGLNVFVYQLSLHGSLLLDFEIALQQWILKIAERHQHISIISYYHVVF